MVLVDTSVWIDFLHGKNPQLQKLLDENRALGHPFIVGELALGSLRDRALTLATLSGLPQAVTARHAEVLHLISTHTLFGSGMGYVDAHLLASVQLTPDASLLTRDKRLDTLATRIGITYHS